MTTKMFKDATRSYLEERDSECQRKYNVRHNWKELGLFKGMYLFLVYRCTTCKKVIYEPLEDLALDEWGKVIE